MSGSQHVVRVTIELAGAARKAFDASKEAKALAKLVGARRGVVLDLAKTKTGLALDGAFDGRDGPATVFLACEAAAKAGATGKGVHLEYADYQDPEGEELTLARGELATKPLGASALKKIEKAADKLLERLADPGGAAAKRVRTELDGAREVAEEALALLAKAKPADIDRGYAEGKALQLVGSMPAKSGVALLEMAEAELARRDGGIAADAFLAPVRLLPWVDKERGEALALRALAIPGVDRLHEAAFHALARCSRADAADEAYAALAAPPGTRIYARSAARFALWRMTHPSIDARVLEMIAKWRERVENDKTDAYTAQAEAQTWFRIASARTNDAMRDALWGVYESLVKKPKPWEWGALRAIAGREWLQATLPLVTNAKVKAEVEEAIRASTGDYEKPVHPAVKTLRAHLGLPKPPVLRLRKA